MTARNWALAAVAGTITMTLIGGAAVAGFQPFAGADRSGQGTLNEPPADQVGRDGPRDGPKDRMKTTLDALVQKGTITQAQEDSILQALKGATPPATQVRPGGPNSKTFLGDLTRATSTYLGLTPHDLLAQLRLGKSVAQVANGIAGKSSDDLVTLLMKTATGRVDQAVAAKKLTPEQAATLRPKIAAEITSFVARSHTTPAPRPRAPVTPTAPPKP